MSPEIRWLVRLGIDQRIFTRVQANAVRLNLGDQADLTDFAQQLIDDGYVDDYALLEKVATAAFVKAKEGPPPGDPFSNNDGGAQAGGPSGARPRVALRADEPAGGAGAGGPSVVAGVPMPAPAPVAPAAAPLAAPAPLSAAGGAPVGMAGAAAAGVPSASPAPEAPHRPLRSPLSLLVPKGLFGRGAAAPAVDAAAAPAPKGALGGALTPPVAPTPPVRPGGAVPPVSAAGVVVPEPGTSKKIPIVVPLDITTPPFEKDQEPVAPTAPLSIPRRVPLDAPKPGAGAGPVTGGGTAEVSAGKAYGEPAGRAAPAPPPGAAPAAAPTPQEVVRKPAPPMTAPSGYTGVPFESSITAKAGAARAVAAGKPPMPTLPVALLGKGESPQLAEAMRTLLRECSAYGSSDLHLCAGARPFIRHNRSLVMLSDKPLDPEDAKNLNLALLTPEQRETYLAQRDFDYALALKTGERYRVNLMVHKVGFSGSYRMVPSKIPRLDDLGLRSLDAIRKLLTYHNGLILVTGPVGSGKTTTLAALVAELNANRQDHIITVEDPIEVVQRAQGCNLTQRQVGPHTASFATALKGALREDPDVIVIGELRDLETIEMAITASETGHLVIGTMHTSDSATTLNRLLDVFPPAQQTQIRASVAESLRGVLCQRLLPNVSGGVVLATELLIANAAVSNLIKEGKTQGLRNVLDTGQREGMCTMESSVFDLYQAKIISADTARQNIITKMMRAKIT